jgi:ABC-type antimicrobial peptide transport system permease subunit
MLWYYIQLAISNLWNNKRSSVIIISGLLALGIALLTVSWQSWRAAIRNPVEALRYE